MSLWESVFSLGEEGYVTGDGLLGPVQWPLSWHLPRAWNPCMAFLTEAPSAQSTEAAQRKIPDSWPGHKVCPKCHSYSYLKERNISSLMVCWCSSLGWHGEDQVKFELPQKNECSVLTKKQSVEFVTTSACSGLLPHWAGPLVLTSYPNGSKVQGVVRKKGGGSYSWSKQRCHLPVWCGPDL